MNLKVWQEDGSGQECHTGSGLELDFPFVPLALRAESWQGGCGGDDGGERSLRDTCSCARLTASAASLSASSVGWRPALNSSTFETFGRVISLQYIRLMERISPSTLPSGISSLDTPKCERLKVQCVKLFFFEGVLPDGAFMYLAPFIHPVSIPASSSPGCHRAEAG